MNDFIPGDPDALRCLGVDVCYVINLNRDKARWAEVGAQFKAVGLPCERMAAVDAKSENFRRRYWDGRKHARLDTMGQLACIASHMHVLTSAMLAGHKRIAVFEDDVVFHADFWERVSVIEELRVGWDIVYLGASQSTWDGVERNEQSKFYRPKHTFGTWAMVIDMRVALELIDLYSKVLAAVDVMLVENFHNSHNCFVLYPNAVAVTVKDSKTASFFNQPYGPTEEFNKLQGWNMFEYGQPSPFREPMERHQEPIIVFGVGHSGTTIVTRMLRELGWRTDTVDEEYCESRAFRNYNDRMLDGDSISTVELVTWLLRLPTVWVIKDPRFVLTIRNWMEAFAEYRRLTGRSPFLLGTHRAFKKVAISYVKRGEVDSHGLPTAHQHSLPILLNKWTAALEQWPWGSQVVDMEQIGAAVTLFDALRVK